MPIDPFGCRGKKLFVEHRLDFLLHRLENTGYGAIVTESLSLVRDAIGQTWLFAFTHGRGAWQVAVR